MNYFAYTHLISGRNFQVRAHICEVGQEKDDRGIWKWVLPYSEPCKCTSVRMGGMNTRTPIRPFKPTYVSKPLVSSDIAKIRKHYKLQCSGKNKSYIYLFLIAHEMLQEKYIMIGGYHIIVKP